MLLQIALGICVVTFAMVLALLPRLRRAEKMQGRIALLRGMAPSAGRKESPLPERIARAVGQAILGSGIVKGETLAELQRTVVAAGFRGPRAVAVFIGAKVLLMVGLPLATLLVSGGLSPMLRNFLVAGAAIAGLVLPDMILRKMRDANARQVERGLADALDLMVICAEAGLPLEASVERVAAEMAEANRALATEFANVSTELRILSDRRLALQNMGDRTGLDSLRRLGGTLAQTLQYGTPLSQALRTLSTELRHETLMRFEARAARLPALLTLPTIAFILPCIFLIVGGPAVLRVLDIAARP
ncbi:type II secretion system F family protein [Roseomonas sp. PWR1]|uniref:Type II secretion system F family protein n=1 Tax=Roseomonas nitratireducens TaxID=2820810 RepID=A0ABS4APC3_9PROT|nr:type II secretion system F family protein [Neoroseomonas nitratireducens]MBP0463205.1 type II secretion system F family protein [Neoroseomonas nitratireducens]